MKGMVLPGHAVRGVRLQLHRPDRRPRRRRARAHARQRARARGPAVPARRHARRATATRAPRTIRSSTTAWPSSIPRSASWRSRRRKPTYTQVFGDWLCDMAARGSAPRRASRRRCAKARASCASRRSFPDRYFDVGIAEQHAVTFAAGLACEGMKPVVAIYSTFLQRAYDQLDPRRRAAEPAGGVRDRPRRARRRRRRDAPRRVRPRLPALPAEHDGDGAGRRERVPADAVHGVHARHAGGGALSARQRARASRSSRRCDALPVGKGEVRRASRSAAPNRIAILAFGAHAAAARWRRPRRSTRRSRTCASSSRSTSSSCCELARDARRARHRRGERRRGRRGQRGGRGARGRGRRRADAAPRAARRVRRPRRSRVPARARAGSTPRASRASVERASARAATGRGRSRAGVSTISATILP